MAAASAFRRDCTPWVEKYRPCKLDDVSGQKEAVSALRACLGVGSNMPHLLFHGPPGTGKTTTVLAIANELFGPDFVRSRVRELNASDDRGVGMVRDKVKKFAHGAAGAVTGRVQSDGKIYPIPPFKLIILDEADALLPDAQAALRRMMEDFSDVTRFCILCNYVSRIIDAISSRCAKFRFTSLPKEQMFDRIRQIAQMEKVKLSDSSLQNLADVAQGDMRLAITYLQSAVSAHGANLGKETFAEVAGTVPPSVMGEYLEALSGGNLAAIQEATHRMVQLGYGAMQVLGEVHRFLTSERCRLSSASRSVLSLKVVETEKRLCDRGDDFLQLLDLGCAFVGRN